MNLLWVHYYLKAPFRVFHTERRIDAAPLNGLFCRRNAVSSSCRIAADEHFCREFYRRQHRDHSRRDSHSKAICGSQFMSGCLPRLRAFSRRRGLAVSRGLEMQLQVIQLAHTFRVQCTQLLVNGGLSWPFARWRVVAEIPLHRLEGG